jgi:hypothetical protein
MIQLCNWFSLTDPKIDPPCEMRSRSIKLKQLHDRIISLRGSMFGSVRLKQLHDRIISLRGKI